MAAARVQIRNRSAGFTLLELLVAMAIFAIIGVMALGGLDSVVTQSTHARAQMAALARLQRAMRLLTTDLSGLEPRYVRDVLGDREPFLRSDFACECIVRLSRGGWSNPAAVPIRGTLQRVQYRLEEQALYRDYWPVMDGVLGLEPRSEKLLEGVNAITLLYLDRSDDAGSETGWIQQWPPLRAVGGQAVPRPRAIRVVLDLEGWGEIERLMELTP